MEHAVCDLGEGLAFSPTLRHKTVNCLFSIRLFSILFAFFLFYSPLPHKIKQIFSEDFFPKIFWVFAICRKASKMDSVEWRPDVTSGVASQPQLGVTRNSIGMHFVRTETKWTL